MKKLLLLLLLSLGFVTLAADVNYRLVGEQLRGDDGSTCRLVGNKWRCTNVKGDSDDDDDDDDWGWGSNRIKYFVDDGDYDYDKAAQGLKNILNLLGVSNSSNAPTINNSLRNTPYYNFGTTYTWTDGGWTIYGSDGLVCKATNYSFNCNNGQTYQDCGNKMCGSDGTSYWSVGNTANGCIKSSFGSLCCGPKNGTKTCR